MKYVAADRQPDDDGRQGGNDPTRVGRLAMADTGPDDVEKRALLAFLDAQRAIVLAVVGDLAEDALRTPVLASGWTPLGMVKHLGFAERHWFQRVATGSVGELPWAEIPGEEEGRKPFTTGLPADVVFGFYRDQCERANAFVAATPLSAPPQGRHPGDPAGEICDLRRIILHMIEETARHAGHLDIARELTGNGTGRGQRFSARRPPEDAARALVSGLRPGARARQRQLPRTRQAPGRAAP
jgi:hypothetical protein